MAAKNMNTEQFHRAMNENRLPVLVEYWAPWCVYCRRIGPALDALEQKYQDNLIIAKINIDEEPVLAAQERIRVVPTLALYQDGAALGSIKAPGSRAEIEEFIRQELDL